MPNSHITPAMVSVAMSRSDSRDSQYSNSSTSSYGFSPAPMTVSYSTSPLAPAISRTISNTSSSSTSTSSLRRASLASSRRDSSSTWVPSPYRSCQQIWEEPSSYLSDDDLLWIAPATKSELPVNTIPTVTRRSELTTEEQIAMLREQQEKEQEGELVRMQQQRRQAAAAAQKAVRFVPESKRRSSSLKKKTTPVTRRS